MIGNYKVVTLCGSTKFKEKFLELYKEFTLKGYVVHMPGVFGHSGDLEAWDSMEEGHYGKTKSLLDDMYMTIIDNSDEIFVVNVNGYIGEGTAREIEHARSGNKIIKYLESW